MAAIQTRPVESEDRPAPMTHAEGLLVFDEVLSILQASGWTRHRIDTLVVEREGDDPRARWTIRHSYDHGVWWFHYEPDAYWRRGEAPHPDARVVKLELAHPQTAFQVINQLLPPSPNGAE